MGTNLRKLRTAKGWTHDEAAEHMGISRGQFIKLERGERQLTERTIALAAKAFGVSKGEVVDDTAVEDPSPPTLMPVQESMVPVPVVGKVEAGAFRVVDHFDDDEPEYIFTERDRAFPNARLVSWDVGGDSMNALKPRPILDGDRLVCVDYEDLQGRVPLRDGMVVVIEQTLDGGHHREWSVKQVEIYEDRREFHPRSTNPKHTPIVVNLDYQADDGREVKILAIVRKIQNEVPLS